MGENKVLFEITVDSSGQGQCDKCTIYGEPNGISYNRDNVCPFGWQPNECNKCIICEIKDGDGNLL